MKEIDPETTKLLETFGFDEIPFETLKEDYKTGRLSAENCRIKGSISLPDENKLDRLPTDLSSRRELADLGIAELTAGRVGIVVLNGGMATRFGGVVKGSVTAFEGKSFLYWKIHQAKTASGGKAPVMLMNSFATDLATKKHLAEIGLEKDVRCFSQFVSLRLTKKGDLYEGANGKPSPYAPGHGDFPYAIDSSDELVKFLERGGRYLTLSNVDNLGASLDPAVIGHHVHARKPMTVEIVATEKGDVGGFPALFNDSLAIAEAFRLPADFSVDRIPYINTNTFVFDAESILNPPDLDWFVAHKKVDGDEVVQFERLVGQLSEYLSVSWLVVPREGEGSRFIPIKTPEDLVDRRDELASILKAKCLLPG